MASWKPSGLGSSEEGWARVRPLGFSGGHGALHGTLLEARDNEFSFGHTGEPVMVPVLRDFTD